MYIPDFKYHKPSTLADAYNILNSHDSIAPIAGGTDLLVEIRQKIRRFDNILSLNNINELNKIEEIDDNILISACVTHSQINRSETIRKYFPALSDAVTKIGTHQIQNTGTIGGNLCTCASCADTAPMLMVYDAKVEIGNQKGTRIESIRKFLVSHHCTILEKGELLLRIIIPKPLGLIGAHFEKFGLRESASISVASVAVGISIENNVIRDARIFIGACASTPMEVPSASKQLLDKNINEIMGESEIMMKICSAAADEVLPIDDIRGSAEYRREIVKTITKRAIIKAINSINDYGSKGIKDKE